LTTPDVKKATEATLDLELKQPIGKETIQLDEHDPKKLTVNQGIRYYPEMKELVLKFQNAGFDVWVVSASTQWIVEVAAKKVGVHANRVLGILLDVDKKQRLTSKILRLTYRKGKADAILKDIGKTPVFAAGDSNTDIEMLLLGSGPRLVIDRGKKPLMDIAKEKAWLIQPKFL
jgi:phosphoserine phosphatase